MTLMLVYVSGWESVRIYIRAHLYIHKCIIAHIKHTVPRLARWPYQHPTWYPELRHCQEPPPLCRDQTRNTPLG